VTDRLDQIVGRPDRAPLTNPRAERVRAVAALAGRSARQRSGRFLVEGPQAVREAVGHAPGSVRAVYLSDESAVRYAEIEDAAADAGLPVWLGTPAVLDAMSADAQGVVAVADLLAPTLGDVLAGGPRLVALLANVRDPGNAGTVIRAADAAGADAVVVSQASVDVFNPKVVRATAGSLFHLPVVTGAGLPAAVAALRAAGLTVLAADGAGELDLDALQDAAGSGSEPDLASPTAWLFGNEAWGLPDDDVALADAVVRVPIRGAAESLNLATAAAICLYASARAHR
jgi:TrmH family RNA methyltransferase